MQKHVRTHLATAEYAKVRSALPRIQRAWRRKYVWNTQKRAATKVQTARRRHRARQQYSSTRNAALKAAALVRGAAGRKRFRQEHAAYVERVTPGARKIQATWRGAAPARYLRAAQAGSVVIQSTYRMARIQKLHQRLMKACVFLKQGGVSAAPVLARPFAPACTPPYLNTPHLNLPPPSLQVLSKYRQGGLMGARERHDRYVRLTPDLSSLVWFPIGHPYQQQLAKADAETVANVKASVGQASVGQATASDISEQVNERASTGEQWAGVNPAAGSAKSSGGKGSARSLLKRGSSKGGGLAVDKGLEVTTQWLKPLE